MLEELDDELVEELDEELEEVDEMLDEEVDEDEVLDDVVDTAGSRRVVGTQSTLPSAVTSTWSPNWFSATTVRGPVGSSSTS